MPAHTYSVRFPQQRPALPVEMSLAEVWATTVITSAWGTRSDVHTCDEAIEPFQGVFYTFLDADAYSMRDL